MQIAKMNAMLTATAGGFKETFAQAGSDVQNFTTKAEQNFAQFRNSAARITESVKTPLEKLKEKFNEIKMLGAKGWLDPATTQKGLTQVLQQAARLRGETDSTRASVKQLGDAVAATSNKASEGATKNLSFLQRLKKATGEDSGFGLAVKTIAGAGALAAIGMAANKFEQMTGAIATAATAYREGKIGASEFTADIVKSIPIIGEVVGGLENITEAITGAKAAAAAATARNAAGRAAINAAPDAFSAKDFVDAANKRAGSLEQDMSTKFMSDFEKAGVEAARKYNDAIWGSVSDSQKAIEDLRSKSADDIAKLAAVANDPKQAAIIRAEAYTKRVALEASLIEEEAKIRKAALREQSAYRAAKEQAIIDAQAAVDKKQIAGTLGTALAKFMEPVLNFKADAPKQIGTLNGIGGFLKKGFNFALNPMEQKVAEAPQLLQAGSQAAASFVNRMQREQNKGNDPAVVAQKKTADNTEKLTTLAQQTLDRASQVVELI